MDAESGSQPESIRIRGQEYCQSPGVQKDSPGSGGIGRHDLSGEGKNLVIPVVLPILVSVIC